MTEDVYKRQDENSVVRRLGYAREESRLRDEIEKYRKEYEENTCLLYTSRCV